jgi:multicomponent Na+:H+ antiporter subunit D
MLLFAGLNIAIGCYPPLLYDHLPFPVEYTPYTVEHVVAQLQLLLFTALAFFLLLPHWRQTPTITLDFDWFYRRFGYRAVATLLAPRSETATATTHMVLMSSPISR